jgi:CheY-specific phosphatase CheX
MSELSIEQLNEAAATALERSAFVFAEPAAAGDLAVLPKAASHARILTTGSVAGELHLSASEGFLRELAASLLGVEPGEVDPVLQGADALREMANMIAGSIGLRCDSEARAFSLGLPELEGASAFADALGAGLSTTLVTNGEPLRVVWVPGAPRIKAAA